MIKKIILLITLCLSFTYLFAQTPIKDTIEIKEKLGVVFKQNGKILTPEDVLHIAYIDPEAYKEIKKGKNNYDPAFILQFVGGGLIGYSLGYSLGAHKAPNLTLIGVGAGMIVVSIPLMQEWKKHAIIGVKIYNKSLSFKR